MKEKIEQLRARFDGELAAATDEGALEALRVAFLGKKGHVAELMKGLRDAQDKRAAGQAINDFKCAVEDAIAAATAAMKEAALKAQLRSAKKYNPTLTAEGTFGSYHPITLATRDVEAVFTGMGFTIEDYAEIVDDYECFEALNIPKHHPARDMQDTYYLENGQLLKTQTSAAQNAIMKK